MPNFCRVYACIITLMHNKYIFSKTRAPASRLNTHQTGSFYDRFDAVTAHQLSNQFRLHYTPTHASWLNVAEIEFAALSKQCLDRRIGDLVTLEKEVVAWADARNQEVVKIKRSAVAVTV